MQSSCAFGSRREAFWQQLSGRALRRQQDVVLLTSLLCPCPRSPISAWTCSHCPCMGHVVTAWHQLSSCVVISAFCLGIGVSPCLMFGGLSPRPPSLPAHLPLGCTPSSCSSPTSGSRCAGADCGSWLAATALVVA